MKLDLNPEPDLDPLGSKAGFEPGTESGPGAKTVSDPMSKICSSKKKNSVHDHFLRLMHNNKVINMHVRTS